ncbi:MAG: sterol desaturase family protein [Chitinophagales bacterium]
MPEFIEKLLMILVGSSFRYAIFAGIPFLIFYVLFKKYFQKNKIQAQSEQRKQFMNEVKHSLTMLCATAIVGAGVLFSPLRAYTHIYTDIAAYPMWWIPMSVVLSLVIHDTYFYWMHRTIHSKALYRRVHQVHHQSTNPSPLASYSFHVLEAFLENFIIVVLVFLMPLHPFAIIGFGLSSFFINVYGHLGYEIVPRWFRHSFLYQILNTSVHHNLHHKEFHGNYGLYFRVWDRLMGTENPNYEAEFDKIQARRFGEKSVPKKRSYALPLLFLVGLGLAMTSFSPSKSTARDISGEWIADGETGAGIVEIYQDKNQKWQGKFVRALNAKHQAKIEAAQKEKSISEILVLRDFEYSDADTWTNGRLFLIKRKQEVNGTLKLLPSGELEVTGKYLIWSKSRIWKRR